MTISAVSAPTTALTGSSIAVDTTVATTGGSSSFYVGIYLSPDATVTTSDIYLGRRSVSSLAPGASSSATTTVAIPNTLTGGSYYIGAVADMYNHVAESNEANNGITGNQVEVTGPDLSVSSVSAPATALTGSSIAVDTTVATTGGSSSFYVGIYLSADATVTTSDIYLGRRYVSSLAPGASSSATTTVAIPNTLAGGSYYIGAVADMYNHVAESNEANNGTAGNQVEVTGPELSVSSVSAPATALTGSSIAVDTTVATTGGSSSFYVGIYLSADATVTTSDIYLGRRSVSSLAPGASSSATTMVAIPNTLAGGSYYIGAVADMYNHVAESNEANNGTAGNQVEVTGPELSVSSVSAPATALTGSSIAVDTTPWPDHGEPQWW